MDLYPRQGKYGHAAAFTLRSGRRNRKTKDYIQPISAIVANFQAPTKTKPSLLSHGEVQTYISRIWPHHAPNTNSN